MLRTERQNQIVDLINKKGIATIEELMAEVAASKATIRRDVNDLATNRPRSRKTHFTE